MIASETKRLVVLLLLAAALAVWAGLEPQRLADLAAWRDGHPVLAFLAALVLASLAGAAPVPGRAALVLAAGAALGFWGGTLASVCGLGLGATAACALFRTRLRGWAQQRFGLQLRRISHGVQLRGAWYLFSMRLNGSTPFFLISAALGQAPIRLASFLWVSILGLLPETMVLANAGRALAAVAGSWPSVLDAFAFLLLAALFPLLAQRGLPLLLERAGRVRTG